MVNRMEQRKAKKGVSTGAKFAILLPLLIGISLAPSVINSKAFYRDFHSTIAYYTTPSFSSSNDRERISSIITTTTTSDRRNGQTKQQERGIGPPVLDEINNDKDPPTENNNNPNDKDDTSDAIITNAAQSTSSLSEPHDNPRTNDSSIHVPHFEKQEGVVIVTQIHGPHQYGLLRQCFCLLHKAYNSKMLYDLIVFLAEPLSPEQEQEVKTIVHPANLTFVNNAPNGLHGLIDELSPTRKEAFLKRCKINETEIHNLTWFSDCPGRLAYNWQAEFRGLRIWRQPALRPYKYMFWLDSDVFATQVWKQDPIAYMVAHDLVVLCGHFGGGRAHPEEAAKVLELYNKSFCQADLTQDGFIKTLLRSDCTGRFSIIHGFSHITNLDFYRTDEVHQWLTHFREHCFLCRQYDDQTAMTVPPAMWAPNRSKDMRRSGLMLNNFHNGHIDGQIMAIPAGFKKYWRINGPNFTEANGVCEITERG